MNEQEWNETIEEFAESQKDALRRIENAFKNAGITFDETKERIKIFAGNLPKVEDIRIGKNNQ